MSGVFPEDSTSGSFPEHLTGRRLVLPFVSISKLQKENIAVKTFSIVQLYYVNTKWRIWSPGHDVPVFVYSANISLTRDIRCRHWKLWIFSKGCVCMCACVLINLILLSLFECLRFWSQLLSKNAVPMVVSVTRALEGILNLKHLTVSSFSHTADESGRSGVAKTSRVCTKRSSF